MAESYLLLQGIRVNGGIAGKTASEANIRIRNNVKKKIKRQILLPF
ncbi:hypothetical protein KCP75_06055 [Salmonella enterica subsp. enterica]|nr:hypothetical protein KCP75_06055 [Salmonella enterica subsp. enterica]